LGNLKKFFQKPGMKAALSAGNGDTPDVGLLPPYFLHHIFRCHFTDPGTGIMFTDLDTGIAGDALCGIKTNLSLRSLA
jgi:hypothetical protein